MRVRRHVHKPQLLEERDIARKRGPNLDLHRRQTKRNRPLLRKRHQPGRDPIPAISRQYRQPDNVEMIRLRFEPAGPDGRFADPCHLRFMLSERSFGIRNTLRQYPGRRIEHIFVFTEGVERQLVNQRRGFGTYQLDS